MEHGPDHSPEPTEIDLWTPHEARRQIELQRNFAETEGEAYAWLFAAAALDWMACPHSDCPRRLLEHEPLAETTNELRGDDDEGDGSSG